MLNTVLIIMAELGIAIFLFVAGEQKMEVVKNKLGDIIHTIDTSQYLVDKIAENKLNLQATVRQIDQQLSQLSDVDVATKISYFAEVAYALVDIYLLLHTSTKSPRKFSVVRDDLVIVSAGMASAILDYVDDSSKPIKFAAHFVHLSSQLINNMWHDYATFNEAQIDTSRKWIGAANRIVQTNESDKIAAYAVEGTVEAIKGLLISKRNSGRDWLEFNKTVITFHCPRLMNLIYEHINKRMNPINLAINLFDESKELLKLQYDVTTYSAVIKLVKTAVQIVEKNGAESNIDTDSVTAAMEVFDSVCRNISALILLVGALRDHVAGNERYNLPLVLLEASTKILPLQWREIPLQDQTVKKMTRAAKKIVAKFRNADKNAAITINSTADVIVHVLNHDKSECTDPIKLNTVAGIPTIQALINTIRAYIAGKIRAILLAEFFFTTAIQFLQIDTNDPCVNERFEAARSLLKTIEGTEDIIDGKQITEVNWKGFKVDLIKVITNLNSVITELSKKPSLYTFRTGNKKIVSIRAECSSLAKKLSDIIHDGN